MDKNVLKITDVSINDYNDVINLLKKKNIEFSRLLLSVNTEIAYAQTIPKPIKPIRGIA